MKTLEQRISILEKRLLKEGRKGDFQVGDLVGNTVIGFDFFFRMFTKPSLQANSLIKRRPASEDKSPPPYLLLSKTVSFKIVIENFFFVLIWL